MATSRHEEGWLFAEKALYFVEEQGGCIAPSLGTKAPPEQLFEYGVQIIVVFAPERVYFANRILVIIRAVFLIARDDLWNSFSKQVEVLAKIHTKNVIHRWITL